MDEPLEAVAFLSRSENRVAILRALDERARNRRELESETGVSRSTLGRVLSDLEERGWIDRDGRAYQTTAAGSLILDRFVPLLETMAGLQTLEDAICLLPVEAMGLDIRHLATARPVTPTELQPTEPYDYHVESLRDTDHLAVIARAAPPPVVGAIHDEVTGGRLEPTIVLDETYLEMLSTHDEIRAKWEDIVSQSGTVLRHDGPIPYVLTVLDETVHLWPCDDEGETWGLLESGDPAVRSWAEEKIADYSEEAQQIELPL